jgi:hypothetical protein
MCHKAAVALAIQPHPVLPRGTVHGVDNDKVACKSGVIN